MDIHRTISGPSNGIIITMQDKQDKFEINGDVYELISDLFRKNANVISDKDYKFDIYLDKFGNYVLCRCEPYPCFDSSDRKYENRFYRSYMICASKDDAIEKYHYIKEHNPDCRASEYTPSFLAPLIYADDGTSIILIMKDSNANNDHYEKVKAPFWNKMSILLAKMKVKLLRWKQHIYWH